MSEPELLVFTDGASRGNPGPSAAGVVVCDRAGREVTAFGTALGLGTNNQAEYKALLLGLEAAARFTAGAIEVASDSEVAVRQLNGSYAVRDAELARLHGQVLAAASRFARVVFTNLRRESAGIARADALANGALDAQERRSRGGAG